MFAVCNLVLQVVWFSISKKCLNSSESACDHDMFVCFDGIAWPHAHTLRCPMSSRQILLFFLYCSNAFQRTYCFAIPRRPHVLRLLIMTSSYFCIFSSNMFASCAVPAPPRWYLCMCMYMYMRSLTLTVKQRRRGIGGKKGSNLYVFRFQSINICMLISVRCHGQEWIWFCGFSPFFSY